MRKDLKDTYKTLSDYDRHYSTVRTTGVIFLFGLSFGIASFLLKDAKELLGNSTVFFIASTIPFCSLVAAFVISCYFQRLTYVCRMYMEGIERTSDWVTVYGTGVQIDQCRINLDRLVRGRKTFEQAERAEREERAQAEAGGQETTPRTEARQQARTKAMAVRNLVAGIEMRKDQLPHSIFFDPPNLILIIALALLLFLPFLVLYQKHSEVIGLHLLTFFLLVILPLLVVVIAVCVVAWWRPSWTGKDMAKAGTAVISASLIAGMGCFNIFKEPPRVCHSGFKQIGKPIEFSSYKDPYMATRKTSTKPPIEDLVSAIIFELDNELKNECRCFYG